MLRRLARVTRLCSSKVTHNRNRIWRSASVGQHHHPRRRRANLSFHGGGSQWGTDENVAPRFGAGQNSRFCHPAVDHSSRANPGNFSRVPKIWCAIDPSELRSSALKTGSGDAAKVEKAWACTKSRAFNVGPQYTCNFGGIKQ